MKTKIVLLIILFAPAICFAKYSGGTGEPNEPYLISTLEDLNSIGLDANDWDKHFLMTADINMADFTANQFNMIGNFTGVFDGDGHSISNLTWVGNIGTSRKVGLFRQLNSASSEIKNLTLIDPNFLGLSEVGALVGLVSNGTISGCGVQGGVISGRISVGGLVGENEGLIRNCWSAGTTVGSGTASSKFIGGLVGLNGGEIIESFAGNDVSGFGDTGGFIGINSGSIQNCYSFGSVKARFCGGFICGNGGTVTNCYSATVVKGDDWTSAFSINGTWYSADPNYAACFWDSDIAQDVNGIYNSSDPNVVGLPTAELQKRAMFADAGWDMINVWDIGENQTYPFLRTHRPGDIDKNDNVNFYDLAILAENWMKE